MSTQWSGRAGDLFHGGTFVWSPSEAETEFSITNVEDWGPYNCKKNTGPLAK
jgi:hypothetical protein